MENETADAAEARGVNVWGLLFIVVGAWWMASELGLVAFDWAIVGPIAVIAVGVSMLFDWGSC